MSIETQPRTRSATPSAPPPWGELTPAGERATCLRFVLSDRVVTYPIAQVSRWEHALGEPELLVISVGKEQLIVEGTGLAPILAALDVGRLVEIRAGHGGRQFTTGPQVFALTLETA